MNRNQLKAGVILTYVSMGLGFLITLVYTPIMLRKLGQSEYGLYNLSSSVVSYLGLLSFGFGTAYLRYYSRFKVENAAADIARLNGMYLLIFSACGAIAAITGAALVLNADLVLGSKITPDEIDTIRTLLAIMAVDMALSFPATVFNTYITAHERFVFQKTLSLVNTVLGPVIMVVTLSLGHRAVAMSVIVLALHIIITAANIIYCFRRLHIQFSFREFDFRLLREIAVFSSYVFINIVSDQINWNIGKFLLGRFIGSAAVAVYGVAATINHHYMNIAIAMSHVFLPRINHMVASGMDNHVFTGLLARVGRIQFAVLSLICLVFVFFGESFVVLWAGADYAGAYPIILLLIIPVTIPLIQTIGLEMLRARNLHKFRSVLYLAISFANLLLSIPLSIQFGGVGAAIGTAISLLLGNGVVMNWYYHKRIGLDIPLFWKRIASMFPALILPCAYGVAVHYLTNLYAVGNLLLYGAGFVLLFLLSMYFLGFNDSERGIFLHSFRKISLRLHR